MQRTIEQWVGCDPQAMATDQSPEAHDSTPAAEAVGALVQRGVRPYAWAHESGRLMLAESTSADDAQLLHRGWIQLYKKPPPLDERRIQKLGETIGAKVPGYSDYESWGQGYRVDETGTHTIPNTPANLVPFTRAIERDLFGA